MLGQYFPAGHHVHAVEFFNAKKPVLHLTGFTFAVVHEDPAGQISQEIFPPNEYEPGVHGMGGMYAVAHENPA
jgi:hypothetical protein